VGEEKSGIPVRNAEGLTGRVEQEQWGSILQSPPGVILSSCAGFLETWKVQP